MRFVQETLATLQEGEWLLFLDADAALSACRRDAWETFASAACQLRADYAASGHRLFDPTSLLAGSKFGVFLVRNDVWAALKTGRGNAAAATRIVRGPERSAGRVELAGLAHAELGRRKDKVASTPRPQRPSLHTGLVPRLPAPLRERARGAAAAVRDVDVPRKRRGRHRHDRGRSLPGAGADVPTGRGDAAAATRIVSAGSNPSPQATTRASRAS